jgi:hypothetical protein
MCRALRCLLDYLFVVCLVRRVHALYYIVFSGVTRCAPGTATTRGSNGGGASRGTSPGRSAPLSRATTCDYFKRKNLQLWQPRDRGGQAVPMPAVDGCSRCVLVGRAVPRQGVALLTDWRERC